MVNFGKMRRKGDHMMCTGFYRKMLQHSSNLPESWLLIAQTLHTSHDSDERANYNRNLLLSTS